MPPEGGASFLSQVRPYAGLFGLLGIATFFEGFDTRLISLVQPLIAEEFGANKQELGLALGLSSLGMMAAFFVIHLADWLGRRPLFLGALGAYAILTLATALAPNLVTFTGLQIFARMAMVVNIGLAYLMLSEEMPAEIRGRMNGLLGAFAALGAAVPDALLAPLESIEISWRGLFWIGALPLLLLPFYFARLPETRAFELRRARAPETLHFDFGEERALLGRLVAPAYRFRLGGITTIWLAINFWSGTALYFFTLYAFNERGWGPSDLALLPYGTIPIGFLGYSLSGFLMDRLGRRSAATLYLIAAFAATAACYQTSEYGLIYAAYCGLIGLGGIWSIATTWTAELFPTELRATAYGVSNNLLGRIGLVVGPIAAGSLSAALGSTADAITLLAVSTLLVLPIVWALPETNAIDLAVSNTTNPTEDLS
ncbi:MAG: MFS transporter [Myxococcota bacterium]